MNLARFGLADGLGLAGALTITISLWAVWPPAAGLFVGSALLAGSVFVARSER